MKRHLITLLAILATSPCLVFAEQSVGGLKIEYSQRFQPQPEKAKQWLSGAPDNAKALTKSFELFEAPPTNGLTTVNLIKVRYVLSIQPNIDGATSESVQNVARLDGVHNFKQGTKQIKVSGHEARLASFEAERYGAKFGGELLVILDRRTNAMWQLQILFGKNKGLFSDTYPELDAERRFSTAIMNSVKVQE